MRQLIGLVKAQGVLPGTDQRGIALVVALLTLVLLAFLGTAFMIMSFTEDQISRNDQEVTQALFVAEAGLQEALNQLNQNLAPPATGTIGAGEFTITVTDVPPPAGQRRIEATAYIPNQASPRALKRIAVLVNRAGGSLFTKGLFGKGSVDVSGGSQTDSYDSALGPYGGANVGSNGDVGSNGSITLSNAATVINGDAAAVGTVTPGPATVTGTITEGAPATSAPDIPCPAGYSPPQDIPSGPGITYDAATGNLSVSNANLTLPGPGPYHFRNVTLSKSTLTVTTAAHVDIYISQILNAKGGSVVNTSADPTQLTVYGCGTWFDPTGMTFWESSGAGTSHMAVYVPNQRFEVSGTGNYYGATVAKDFSLTGGSTLHYDEALGRVSAPGSKYSILAGSWTELGP